MVGTVRISVIAEYVSLVIDAARARASAAERVADVGCIECHDLAVGLAQKPMTIAVRVEIETGYLSKIVDVRWLRALNRRWHIEGTPQRNVEVECRGVRSGGGVRLVAQVRFTGPRHPRKKHPNRC